jgi:outer membrane protein OmpA-like peptidoglycan-associated protein
MSLGTRSIVSGVLACALAASASPALAQSDGESIDLNAFRPAMDSRGYVTLNASQVLGHKEVSFGLVTTWRRGLVKLESGGNEFSVDNIITPTLLGAFGIKSGPLELELGLSIPFQLVNGDRGPDFTGDPGPNDDENFAFEAQGIGDIGLHAKIRFLNTSKGPKIGLAVIGSIYFPTPSEDRGGMMDLARTPWLGDGAFTPQGMVVLDKESRNGILRAAINAGIRVPTETHTFNDNVPEPDPMEPEIPLTNGTIENGPTIPWGAGVSYAVAKQKFDLVAEVYGAVPLGGEGYFPVEAIAAAKVYLARNSFLSIGGGVGILDVSDAAPDARAFIGIIFEPNIGDRDGDGIKDDVDQCPDDPEDYDDFEDEDGCPEPDNDRDGILDEDDQCPNEPEDKDGFEDEDGCPENNALDRDGDGILDDVDECPDEPEDKDDFEDDDGAPERDNDGDGINDDEDECPDAPEDPGSTDRDGCPETGHAEYREGKIRLLGKIRFKTDSAEIEPASDTILDDVADEMKRHPEIRRVRVEGHSDNVGNRDYNRKLSRERAQSVRQALIKRGVSGKRLDAEGYGERQPIASNRTERGRAKNRRVQFTVLK